MIIRLRYVNIGNVTNIVICLIGGSNMLWLGIVLGWLGGSLLFGFWNGLWLRRTRRSRSRVLTLAERRDLDRMLARGTVDFDDFPSLRDRLLSDGLYSIGRNGGYKFTPLRDRRGDDTIAASGSFPKQPMQPVNRPFQGRDPWSDRGAPLM